MYLKEREMCQIRTYIFTGGIFETLEIENLIHYLWFLYDGVYFNGGKYTALRSLFS